MFCLCFRFCFKVQQPRTLTASLLYDERYSLKLYRLIKKQIYSRAHIETK